jgi:hypothetical protein
MAVVVSKDEIQITAAIPRELGLEFKKTAKGRAGMKRAVAALVKLWLELPKSEQVLIPDEKGSILSRLRKLPESTEDQIVDSGLSEVSREQKKVRKPSKIG